MKKLFLSIFCLSMMSGGLVYSQNYVNENFNNVGSNALPPNWSAPSYWTTGTADGTVPYVQSGMAFPLILLHT